MHVDHLRPDPLFGEPGVAGEQDLAVLDQRGLEARAPHVGRDDLPGISIAEIKPDRGPRRRTRQQRRDRIELGGVAILDAAVRLDQQQMALEAAPAQLIIELIDIGGEDRADIGADHRGVEAFELSRAGDGVIGRRDECLGRDRTGDLGGAQLVLRPDVGIEKADRDRLDAFGLEAAHRLLDLFFVERRDDLAVGTDPLVDADPTRARNQRLGEFDLQIIGRHADAHAAPQFDDVAKPLGGEHAGLDAGAGEQRIRRRRGAVDDGTDLIEQFRQPACARFGGLAETVHDALGQASVRRW